MSEQALIAFGCIFSFEALAAWFFAYVLAMDCREFKDASRDSVEFASAALLACVGVAAGYFAFRYFTGRPL